MDPSFFAKSLEGNFKSVIGLDPGETTGVCWFVGPTLQAAQQIIGLDVPSAFQRVKTYILAVKPDIVVMEDYKIYAWKTKDHTWASLFTPRLIGAIECLCNELRIPLVKQMAGLAKPFCTDERLREWGFWQRGERHSRDAIRHTCYYLLFSVAKVQVRSPT